MITDDDLPAASAAAHAVIDDAKPADVYVFGGGDRPAG